ncbi:MAG: hypothetical protein WC423_21820 [Vulcanimicrobiota bacterium]
MRECRLELRELGTPQRELEQPVRPGQVSELLWEGGEESQRLAGPPQHSLSYPENEAQAWAGPVQPELLSEGGEENQRLAGPPQHSLSCPEKEAQAEAGPV